MTAHRVAVAGGGACFALLVFTSVTVAAFFAAFGNWALMVPAVVLVGWMTPSAWRPDRWGP